jgi:hypothetical protein
MPREVADRARKFSPRTTFAKAQKLEHEASKIFAGARKADKKGINL